MMMMMVQTFLCVFFLWSRFYLVHKHVGAPFLTGAFHEDFCSI